MTQIAATNAADRSFGLRDYALYATVVLSWSASWYAIKMQLGEVPVQVSMFWRFFIAAFCMWVWVFAIRQNVRYSLKYHAAFAAMGLFIFCLNFTLFYHGGTYLISGLLSVVFSLASVFNLVLAGLIARQMPAQRILLGALLGFLGIALMFWPEIAGQSWDTAALFGLSLCVAGTLSFCVGSQISAALQNRAIPVIAASAWGMSYGALFSGLFTVLQGHEFAIVWTPQYLFSLLFLAIISSVIAFWSYLNLIGSIGAGRAGYVTVMFPVAALLISTILEDYRFAPIAIGGLVLVLLGNLLVLSRGRNRLVKP